MTNEEFAADMRRSISENAKRLQEQILENHARQSEDLANVGRQITHKFMNLKPRRRIRRR